jgi:hypothetical protein
MDEAIGVRSYLKAADESEKESVIEHPEFMGIFDELDAIFRILVTGRSYGEHPASSLLGVNAHAAFLAAVGTALRGQFAATFMILRGCVESAFYAYLASLSKEDADIWLKRGENIEASKAKFTANRAIQKLLLQDPNLGTLARETYQWMIEFGAHPNPRSIIDHVRVQEPDADGNTPVSMIYIHGADSTATARCLAACAENACLALGVLCHSLPDHPEMEGNFKKTWELFTRAQQMFRDQGFWDGTHKELA